MYIRRQLEEMNRGASEPTSSSKNTPKHGSIVHPRLSKQVELNFLQGCSDIEIFG